MADPSIDHAALAVVEARVTGLERALQDIAQSLGGLSAKMDERSKTQWPTLIGFLMLSWSVLGGLGFFALQTVKSDMDSFKAYYESNRLLSRTDSNDRFSKIETGLVSRGEHERVWLSNDQRFVDMQRQLDELKLAQGSVYGARDVIQDLKRNQDRLEEQIARILSKQ